MRLLTDSSVLYPQSSNASTPRYGSSISGTTAVERTALSALHEGGRQGEVQTMMIIARPPLSAQAPDGGLLVPLVTMVWSKGALEMTISS